MEPHNPSNLRRALSEILFREEDDGSFSLITSALTGGKSVRLGNYPNLSRTLIELHRFATMNHNEPGSAAASRGCANPSQIYRRVKENEAWIRSITNPLADLIIDL